MILWMVGWFVSKHKWMMTRGPHPKKRENSQKNPMSWEPPVDIYRPIHPWIPLGPPTGR